LFTQVFPKDKKQVQIIMDENFITVRFSLSDLKNVRFISTKRQKEKKRQKKVSTGKMKLTNKYFPFINNSG